MAQTTERSRGQLLVGAGGVVAAIGSLASFPLLVAASSSAAPGNCLGVVLALVLGGVLGSVVAARGFVHLAVGSPLRVALLALVVGISGLAAPWIIAVVTGAVGYRSVA
jgi:hypothetical protein